MGIQQRSQKGNRSSDFSCYQGRIMFYQALILQNYICLEPPMNMMINPYRLIRIIDNNLLKILVVHYYLYLAEAKRLMHQVGGEEILCLPAYVRKILVYQINYCLLEF